MSKIILEPLQGAIAQAESWTRYMNACRSELEEKLKEEAALSLESMVWAATLTGEVLPFTWRLIFDNLFQPGSPGWMTLGDWEAIRKEIRRFFFSAGEAMDLTRQLAEIFQARTGRKPAGMDRLCAALDNARRLEESVFRDWPSFTEPPLPGEPGPALSVDESLAHALGITVDEARRRMEMRRGEKNKRG